MWNELDPKRRALKQVISLAANEGIDTTDAAIDLFFASQDEEMRRALQDVHAALVEAAAGCNSSVDEPPEVTLGTERYLEHD